MPLYNSDKEIDELDLLTTLEEDDLIVVGDISDTQKSAKAITLTNISTVIKNIINTLVGENKVNATATDEEAGVLDDKIEFTSSNNSVTITKSLNNPGGNEKLVYDLIAQGSAIGSSGGVGNISEAFDDFVTGQFILGSDTNSAKGYVLSGNFAYQDTGAEEPYDATTELDHPGVVNIDQSTPRELKGFYADLASGLATTKGLLWFGNDFDISIMAETAVGVNYTEFFELMGSTSTVGLKITDVGSAGVYYNVGSGYVLSAVSVPTDDWHEIRFVNASGTLTIYLDGEIVISATLTATDDFGVYCHQGGNSSTNIDYVRTKYRTIGSGTKKVGVGESDDIEFFNIQYPFAPSPGGTPDPACMWDVSNLGNPLLSPSFVVFQPGNYIAVNDTSYEALLPDIELSTGGELKFDSGKLVVFQATISSYTTAGVIQGAGIGFDAFGQSALIIQAQGSTDLGVGFVRKKTDGTWYARAADGSAYTENLISISDGKHVLRCEYDPANGQARYYVDGSLVSIITTNLPTGDSANIGFSAGNRDSDLGIDKMSCPSFAVET